MEGQLLALTFTSPWIATAGAAVATVPILLHLLNCRRYRRVRWAAMQFLTESRQRNRRRLLLEDVVLLVLRCTLILLIALAVARPLGAVGGFGGKGIIDHWFIIDDSASMGATHGSSSCFVGARADVLDLMGRVPATDRLGWLTTSVGWWMRLERADDLPAIVWRIESMTVSDSGGGLVEGVADIASLVAESDDQARVVILSDFRRVDLAGALGNQLATALAELDAEGADIVLIDHGRPVERNLTIEEIRPLDRHVIAGLPTRVAVTIHNYGLSAAPAGRLALAIDDVELPVLDLPAIPAGESRTIEARCVFPAAGPSVVRAQLPADVLAADNTRHRVFEPRDALAVLIVDGERGADLPGRSDAFYLQTALDPHGDGSFGVAPEMIGPGGVGNVDLDDYDLVVLAGVGRFPEQLDDEGRLAYPVVGALGRYVRAGGGVVVFTGDGVDAGFYNDVLYDRGRGLLPLAIEPAVGDARTREQPVKLLAESLADVPWLTRAFGGDMAVLTDLVSFFRYTPTIEAAVELPHASEPPEVLARFSDHRSSPAIIRRRVGEGVVVMITTSVGARWHDWAGSTNMTYLPVMNDMVTDLARQRTDNNNIGPLGDLVCPVDDATDDTFVELRTPAFPREDLWTLRVQSVDGGLQVTYGAAKAGVYEFTWPGLSGRPHRKLIARTMDPVEGDLAKATEAEIRAIAPASATYIDRTAEGQEAPLQPDRPEYWRWLLVAALAVLALEVWLAQKFGHYTR